MLYNRYENSLNAGTKLNTRPNLLPGNDKVRAKEKKKTCCRVQNPECLFHFIELKQQKSTCK